MAPSDMTADANQFIPIKRGNLLFIDNSKHTSHPDRNIER